MSDQALEPQQLSPISIQAASLIRSIDALSRIFWISVGGTILTIFFAGLSQLESNITSDYISLGEYQVPKAILPLAGLSFALFAFWITSNRLKMLQNILQTTRLPEPMVHEIFHLNPPLFNIFDEDNLNFWSPLTGVSALIITWAIFFGNSIALTWSGAVQNIANFASFNITVPVLQLLLTVVVIIYGVRTIMPPTKAITHNLHGIELSIGWPRIAASLVLLVAMLFINHRDQFRDVDGEADNDLIGPAPANAIDGGTLFIRGTEFKLLGIDAMAPDQLCQNAKGEDYACGRAATLALQKLVERHKVICAPLFAIGDHRLTGACEIVSEGTPLPTSPGEVFTRPNNPNNLSRHQIAAGHALFLGAGRVRYEELQYQAQENRVGIWQGSFMPPTVWRSKQAN